jgi:hypothetical protein
MVERRAEVGGSRSDDRRDNITRRSKEPLAGCTTITAKTAKIVEELRRTLGPVQGLFGVQEVGALVRVPQPASQGDCAGGTGGRAGLAFVWVVGLRCRWGRRWAGHDGDARGPSGVLRRSTGPGAGIPWPPASR